MALRFSPVSDRPNIHAHYSRSVKVAILAVAVQVIALGLILYDSDRQSAFDALQGLLLPIRLFVPLLPYVFMLPPLLLRHRRDERPARSSR
jgi:hypothetical protein